MVTPVSTQNSYSVILTDLLSSQNKELTAQQQVSTGKKGNELTDFGDQTRSLIATNTVNWRPGMELIEYVCNEDEKSSVHMIGK